MFFLNRFQMESYLWDFYNPNINKGRVLKKQRYGGGFLKGFSKVMTILANEVIITGPIGPVISIWLTR